MQRVILGVIEQRTERVLTFVGDLRPPPYTSGFVIGQCAAGL